MNKHVHLDDKLTVTTSMKGALARNTLAVNKMKASMGAIGSDTKRTLKSLEQYKQKYEKRQRELRNEKERALGRAVRKISAPSRLSVPTIDGSDFASGEVLTDLKEPQKSPGLRQRSISLDNEATLPALSRSESGGKFREIAQPKEGLTLPSIDASNGRRRRLNSASTLNGRSVSSSLTVPTSPNIAQSRSAPSSPCMPRRAEVTGNLSSSGRGSRSPVRNMSSVLSLLDFVQKKNVPDFEEAMTKLKDIRNIQEEERKAKENTEHEKTVKRLASIKVQEGKADPKTRKSSSPGTTLYSPGPEKIDGGRDNRENQKTLEESMNDFRYCRYLRTPSQDEALLNEGIPAELVPKVIIVGHTEWVPGD